MPIQLTDKQEVTVAAAPADADGNPTGTLAAGVTLAITVSDPTAITVTMAADGLSATLVPAQVAGKLGTYQVVAATSDGLLSAQDNITVVADVATQLGITFGTPTAIPAAPAAPQTGATGA